MRPAHTFEIDILNIETLLNDAIKWYQNYQSTDEQQNNLGFALAIIKDNIPTTKVEALLTPTKETK